LSERSQDGSARAEGVGGMSASATGMGPAVPRRSSGRGRSSGRSLTDLKYRFPGRYMASWAALVLLVVVAAVAWPASVRGDSIQVVSALAGVLALAAFGQLLVIMIGGIDLSVPAILAATAGVVVHYGVPGSNLPLVILAAVLVAIVISLVNGIFISVLRLNALIVTLATFGIVTGAIGLWTGVSFSLTGQAPASLQRFAKWSTLNLDVCFLIAVAVAVVLALVLWRTRAGRQVAAVGSNRRAAHALGVRDTLVEMTVFAAVGLLYGVAGVLLAGFLGTPDITVGSPYQIATITAAAIAGVALNGGPGSVASVLSACVFLELLNQALIVAGLPAGAQGIVQGGVLVIAVAAITLGQYGLSGLRRGRHLVRVMTRRA
jgi:ribose transport system permease protein